tara:strand:- start:31706 stop:32533 length:828 start_codon:yes stop_codon:yes gene_type:complete
MSNYYYILSSLPQLKLDKSLSEEDLDEAWQLIQRNASAEDLKEIAWFWQRNDLYNLLETWQYRFLNYPLRPLRKPYSLTTEDLAASEKDIDILPPLWREFYLEHKEEIIHWTANEMDSYALDYYFDQLALKADPFISQLFAFEREVRSLMATFNTSLYPFANKEIRYGSTPLHQQLLKGKSSLSEKQKLGQTFLQPLLNALATKDPQAITNAVHQVLWNKADTLASAHYFDRLALLNYCSKLFLIYRREQLSSNQQKPFLRDLLGEALKNINHHD